MSGIAARPDLERRVIPQLDPDVIVTVGLDYDHPLGTAMIENGRRLSAIEHSQAPTAGVSIGREQPRCMAHPLAKSWSLGEDNNLRATGGIVGGSAALRCVQSFAAHRFSVRGQRDQREVRPV